MKNLIKSFLCISYFALVLQSKKTIMTRHHSITRLGKTSLTKITKPIKAYNNLDLTKIIDKRLFLKAVKRHFTDKTLKYERITLVEVGKFLSEKYELAKLFHNHYGRGLERLKL